METNQEKLMLRHKKWTFLWVLIPILVVGAFLLLAVNYLIDPGLYRNILQKALTVALDREVTIGKAKISLWHGVGITFEDVRVKNRSLTTDLLQSKNVILKAKLLPLLKREVKWKRIVFEQPILHLVRDKNGSFNIFNGSLTREELRASEQKMLQILSTLFGGSLSLRDGRISLSDESLGPSPLVTEIRSFNLQLSGFSQHKPFPFRIEGEIHHSQRKGHFSIAGKIRNILEDMDISRGKIETDVELQGIDLSHFWPYLNPLLPMKTISGLLDLKGHYQGDGQGIFKTSAKINLKEVVFDYPQVFSYLLTPKWLKIDLDVEYDRKDIRVPKISVEMPEIGVRAKGKIYAIGTKEMGMEAEAQSGPFDLADGRKFIPYRIITPDVSEPLFRAEGSGPVQIQSVKLSGKMTEIDHCDQLKNAHVLSVEMTVDKTRLKLPWNLPALEDLKGLLQFKEGNLHLKGVEGRVFHSSLEKVDGAFFELLHVPTLQVRCEGRFDLTDLSALAKIEGLLDELREPLSPIHIHSGRAQYSLSVKGILKPPLRFQHQGTYHFLKTRFVHQQIPYPILIEEGRANLSNEGLQWSETAVEFGQSSLMMNGSWKWGEKVTPVEIVAKGRVELKNLFSLFQSPLFPEEFRLRTKGVEGLSGLAQISFKGKRLAATPAFSYEGEILPREVSLLQKGNPIPFIFKEGMFTFSNLGVGFSKAKVLSGRSSLVLDGMIKEGNINLYTRGSIDLKQLHSLLRSPLFSDEMRSQMDGIQEISGEAEVRLKWLGRTEQWASVLREGEVRLKKAFLQHQKIPVPLSHIEGSFLLSPEQIRVEGLKGMVGDSPLTVSGTLSRLPSSSPPAQSIKPGIRGEPVRRLTFQISSSQLNLDSLFPKREETASASFEGLRDWLSNWSLEGRLHLEQGSFRNLQYQDLKVELKTAEGKLFFSPFQLSADGGDLWGEGWIEPAEKGVKFEIKPRISNMEAKAFLRTLLQKGEGEKISVSGRVHLDKVELRGEGEDFQKLKESLHGQLRLELENGVIERASILAKIFSILNVSQLFKGRLPDLKTKGLPYQHIAANIQVKEGVASTEDFLVDSDAMKITLVGKVDVGKNLIDANVGVHPLVTVDTVLSSVPIAGYILTGKDKAFISYIYEVKGNLDDPSVKGLPIKSIGEGFWGIIKRLIETPLRPFQKAPSKNNDKNG